MAFCPGSNSGKPITSCPYVSLNMALDDIPTFLGGNCNCFPGGCIAQVPNSQTFSLNSINADGLASITVNARAFESLELPLSGGMKISWLIKVELKKLEISVLFKPNRESGKDDEVLVSKQFIDQDCPITGEFNATLDGTAVIIFDNQKSFMTSKKILYKIDITE
jgi:hypothetical protein